MTIKEFTERIYNPAWKKANGKKVPELDDKERMIFAIEDCSEVINKAKWSAFEELRKQLDEIGCGSSTPQSKGERIKEVATFWNVDPKKLLNNLNSIFAK